VIKKASTPGLGRLSIRSSHDHRAVGRRWIVLESIVPACEFFTVICHLAAVTFSNAKYPQEYPTYRVNATSRAYANHSTILY